MRNFAAMTFGDVANVISVVSGLMTILGIGGIVSWSLVTVERGSLAQNTISVFAAAVKTGLCALSLWPAFMLFAATHIFVVLSLGPGVVGGQNFFWDSSHPAAFAFSYLLNTSLWVPVYTLACACIFTWSFGPLRLFVSTFRRGSSKDGVSDAL